MPPSRRAGTTAYVEKFTNKYGEPGFVIHCRICRQEDREWSTRSATRRFLGLRQSRGFYAWEDMMDLWTLHMQIHHPEHEQPDWSLSKDLDPAFADREASFFDRESPTPEEIRLQQIFGDQKDAHRNHEREVSRLYRAAEKLGHKVSLPAEKTRGVWSGSQGWVCICGATGKPDTSYDTGLVKEDARNHLRAVLAGGDHAEAAVK